MSTAVPSRRRHLLVLCGLSAALHVLLLEIVARHGVALPSLTPGHSGPLMLRLAPVTPAPSVPDARTPGPPTGAPRGMTEPGPTTAPSTAPSTVAVPMRTSAPPVSDPPPILAPVPEAKSTSSEQSISEVDAANQDMPQRYRVRMPNAVHLAYALTHRDSSGRAAPSLPAVLDWRTDGVHYLLQMDGVLGRLSSSGSDSDAGLDPASAVEETGGQQLVTRIDAGHGRVQFANGSEAGAVLGIQDRSSLLMQLAGIGLARPDQIRDVLSIPVVGADGTGVERFRVMGQEQVDTALGPMSTWRLAQVVAPGATRLEVWLAPSRDWLPVMLRVTAGDGSSSTQVLVQADPGTAP